MVKTASPEGARRLFVMAGVLGCSLFILVASWELYSGTASVSQRRPLPNLEAVRADNPTLYWSYFGRKLVIAGLISGSLIAFGQFIVWLNRRPGSKDEA